MDGGFHHLHARKRLYKGLEPFPSRGFFKRILDYVMYGVAIVQPAALIPQALDVLHGHTAGASPVTWGLLGGVGVLWLLYGIVHNEKPIIISNLFSVILDFLIVYGIYTR